MVLSINTSQFTNIPSPLVGEGQGEGDLNSSPSSNFLPQGEGEFNSALWNRLTQASSRFVRGDAAVIGGSVAMGLLFSSAASALLPATLAGGLMAMGVGVLANSLGGVVGGEIVLSLLHYAQPYLFQSLYQCYVSGTNEGLDEAHELALAYLRQWMTSASMSFILGTAATKYAREVSRWAQSSNVLVALAGKSSQKIAATFEPTRRAFANRFGFESSQEFAEHWGEVLGGKKVSYAVSILTGGGHGGSGIRDQGLGFGDYQISFPPREEIIHLDPEIASVIHTLQEIYGVDLAGCETRNFISGPIVIAIPTSAHQHIGISAQAPTILTINNRCVYLVTQDSPVWNQLVREHEEQEGYWTNPADKNDPDFQAFAHGSVGAAKGFSLGTKENPLSIELDCELSAKPTEEEIGKVVKAIMAQDSELYPGGDATPMSASAKYARQRWYVIGEVQVTLSLLAGWLRRARGRKTHDTTGLPTSKIIRGWKEGLFKIEVSRANMLIQLDFELSAKPTEEEIGKVVKAIVAQDSELYPGGNIMPMSTGPKYLRDRWYEVGDRKVTLGTLTGWVRRARGLKVIDIQSFPTSKIIAGWKRDLFGIEKKVIEREVIPIKLDFELSIKPTEEEIGRIVKAIVAQCRAKVNLTG